MRSTPLQISRALQPDDSKVSAALAHIRTRLGATLIAGLTFGACSFISKPPFEQSNIPPEPAYNHAGAWLAYPGQQGLVQSAPKNTPPIDERQARADVFFIHPTTYKGSDVMNAPYDASDAAAPLFPAVIIEQLSVFNGCCRIFAPRYRQASLAGLKNAQAVELAYSDIARAFRYYIAHENHGRPFIIASHSQGTTHAIRLLQKEILQTPLKNKMVAAYLIGNYVPNDFGNLGLPTCQSSSQIGCILSYNTSQTGRSLARKIIENKTYWWQGADKSHGQPPTICVNPLTWDAQGSAPAEANTGSLPLPDSPYPNVPRTLDLTPHLTGAVCHDGMLEVDIPSSSPAGFHDILTLFTGSYHLNDYGIFYASLRQNTQDRVNAWLNAEPSASP